MGVMPIPKLLITMSLPMILSMLVQALYNVVDSIFVAKLNEAALTAVSLAFPVQNLMIAIAVGTGVGINALLSRYLGEHRFDSANDVARNGIFISIITGLIFTIVGVSGAGVFFRAQTSDPDIISYGTQYMQIVTFFAIAIFMQITGERLMQSTGKTFYNMITQGLGAIINIILDPILIFGLFGLPRLEVAGAAIATVAAQALSVVFALILLVKMKLPFTITKKDFRLNVQCKRFFQIGLPLALQECLTQISFLALCAFVNRLGLEASSGYGVACKIVNFAMLVPSSLMQSMASFVSQNIGAGKKKRAKQSMFTGIGVGLAVGCVVFILVMFKGDMLAGIFSTDAEVISNAFDYLKGFAPETIVTAILFSMIGYFNGNNKTVWVMIQGLIQTLLVRLPLAYFMSIQPDANLTKIGLAAPVATVTGIILNVGFYIYLNRTENTPG